jgi:hypothetical protein
VAAPKVTGGDLYHLWRVSEVHLPRIADAFYDGTRLLAGGESSGGEADTDAFRANQSAYPGSTAMSSGVGAAWEMVRDEMQRGLAQVGDTVLEAAAAVRQATQVYLTEDAHNANLLNAYLQDPHNHDPNDIANNPPAPGADDDPGKPALPVGEG